MTAAEGLVPWNSQLIWLTQRKTIFSRNLGMDKVLVIFSEYKYNIFYMA